MLPIYNYLSTVLNKQDGVSVIICCYNSAQRLPETLKYIYHQKVSPEIKWELIIVDNNSLDGTSSVAKSEWQKYNSAIPFKIAVEEKQGLSFARVKGVDNAAYDVLVFCDDDNWLQDDYLQSAFDIMQAHKNVAIAGGISTACFETEKPAWFDAFAESYAVGEQMKETGIANTRTYIAGAAVVVRKAIYNKLDALSHTLVLTGRKGKSLMSGEDTELCWLAMFMGFDLYYDSRLRFVHFMPKQRLTWQYCVAMISKGQSIPRIYFSLYHYCYEHAFDREKMQFEYAYKVLFKRHLNYLRKHNKGWKSLLKTIPVLLSSAVGSKKEIEVKSDLAKLKYIWLHKADLKKDFEAISSVMKKIKHESFTTK